jgi:hypothetical protein
MADIVKYRLPEFQPSHRSGGRALISDRGIFSVLSGSADEQVLIAAGAVPASLGGAATVTGGIFPAAACSYGAVMDAFNAAAAAGGGSIQIPAGGLDMTGYGQAFPKRGGIVYRGSGWTTTGSGIPDDGNVVPNGGTWLLGNSSFDAFDFDSTDGSSAYSTPGAFTAALGVNMGIYDLGVQGFRNGCKIGSNYNPGAAYSTFSNICAIGCSGWGWWFENCIHNRYDKVYSLANLTGGQRYRSSSTSSILAPANNQIGEIVSSIPAGSITARGIVISCANGTGGGIASAQIVQSNRFNGGTTTQAATMSSSSTSIGVTDLSKFLPFMPVAFSASANGFVKNQIYFVQTVSGSSGAGNITVANTPYGSAIAATSNSAVNILSQGFPCLEVIAEDSNGASNPNLTYIGFLDLEAGGTAKLVANNFSVPFYWNANGVSSASSTEDICFRSCNTVGTVNSGNSLNIDADSGSVNNIYNIGGLGANSLPAGGYQGIFGNGTGRSLNLGYNSFQGSGAPTFANKSPGGGADYTYPGLALGQLTFPFGNTTVPATLSAGLGAGCFPYQGTTSGTWTLPTITAALNGCPFEIANASTTSAVVLTLAAGSGQNFNGQSSKTSYTMALGASISVRAVYTGGTNFWQVTGNNGAA